jgi:hypothetical protein
MHAHLDLVRLRGAERPMAAWTAEIFEMTLGGHASGTMISTPPASDKPLLTTQTKAHKAPPTCTTFTTLQGFFIPALF